ncbi:MAG: glutamate--tRNA ligase [Atribacterota bacterium]
MDGTVRARFAPSPTGFLHLGGARTSLFNWAFARNNKGTFILRIEDTDMARSTDESVDVILDSLKWLGFTWDEGPGAGGDCGPYFQSERRGIYKEYLQKLLDKGHAYYCFCTPEELAERREKTLAEGNNWRYDRHCLRLSPEEVQGLLTPGKKVVLRFRIPEGTTTFIDMLRGDISFHNTELDDFVILKSDGMPTYNFACVVDDALMHITHVIRGDDHISNTPRQVLLYRALDFCVPEFAHIPMILGHDKTRLSKRHGSPSVTYYRDKGYLPEAMVNYLARLSWASGEEEKEIFSREEILDRFSLDQVTKHSAVFDLDKLNWMNSLYIRQASNAYLAEILIQILTQEGLKKVEEITPEFRSYCEQVVSVMKERMKYVALIVEEAWYFFDDTYAFDPAVFEKILLEEGVSQRLKLCRDEFHKLPAFTMEATEDVVRKLSESLNVKATKLIHPLRVAVSGVKVGPGLFELLVVLGKERVLSRIDRALQAIQGKK